MLTNLLLYGVLALVGTGIIWKGSGLLEQASERLAVYYRLPDIVQGAVVVAVGSSFPELSTTVISTMVHGEFDLGVSAIVGSAIFNILVIPGLSGLAGKEQLQANRDLVYKEAQFYLIAVAVLLLSFSFAVIYSPVASDGAGSLQGEMTRGIALVPLAAYGLYLFLQWQDSMEFESDVDASDISVGKEWLRLLASLALILIGVEMLVLSAVKYGEILGTPSALWGLTVVAAGTSIPDAFVSVRAARHGRAVTSIANVLGSNVFDLLVCIPVGVLIAGVAVIDYAVAAPMMAVLTVATLVLFVFLRTGLALTKKESVVLLLLYAAFVGWMILETLGVTSALPGFTAR